MLSKDNFAKSDGILCAGLEIQRFDKIGTSQQIPRSVGCSGCWNCLVESFRGHRQEKLTEGQWCIQWASGHQCISIISASSHGIRHLMKCGKVQGVFLIRNCSPHPYIPGTLNNPCLMDVWLNNHFRRKDWKTLNHPIETTFQEWLFGF